MPMEFIESSVFYYIDVLYNESSFVRSFLVHFQLRYYINRRLSGCLYYIIGPEERERGWTDEAEMLWDRAWFYT
jgi:hypothetical protein